MSKIAVLAKLTAQPGKRDEIIAAFEPMMKAVADEPGTELYAFHTANDDPDVVGFYELYSDGDALAKHGGSEAMKAAGGRLAGLVAGRPELIMLTPVSAKGLSV